MDKEREIFQKQVINSIPENPHGRLLLVQRSGKTRIAIELIKRDKPKSILWVSPSPKLIAEDLPKEFIKWKAKKWLDKVTFSTYSSLPKISGHFDWVILDEEQYITPRNMQYFLFKKKVTYNNILTLSGTKTKNKVKKKILEELGLDILYEIGIEEGVNQDLIADYLINVIYIPINTVPTIERITKKGQKFKTSESKTYSWYSQQIAEAIENIEPNEVVKAKRLSRRRFISNLESKEKIAKSLLKKEGRKIIFCGSIAQAVRLCPYNYHSKSSSKDLQKFIKGEINEISMVNAGGVGFTYKNVDHLIIIQVDSDTNGNTSQKLS